MTAAIVETDGRAIYPTPVIGMVGVIEDVSKIMRHPFRSAGDDIVLLGENSGEIGGSEYLYVTADLVAGAPPAVDLEGERSLQQAVLKMIQETLLHSAHDCSEGGIAAALVECALGEGEDPLGVDVELDDDLRPVVALFGESQGRIVVSCDPSHTSEVLAVAERYGVPARRVGSVTDGDSGFSVKVRGGSISTPLDDAAEAYFGAIPRIMDAAASAGE